MNGDQGPISEEALGLVDRRERVPDIASLRRCERRLDVGPEQIVQECNEVEERDAFTASHVHDLANGVGCGIGCEHAGLHRVRHECEIAGLFSVTEHDRRFTREHPRGEAGDHRCVFGGGVLPGPEHVEEPKGHRLDAVRTSECPAVGLPREFRRGVRRTRP